jgi:hypothetical protein
MYYLSIRVRRLAGVGHGLPFASIIPLQIFTEDLMSLYASGLDGVPASSVCSAPKVVLKSSEVTVDL